MAVTLLNNSLDAYGCWQLFGNVNSILDSITYIGINSESKACWLVDCGDPAPVLDFLDGYEIDHIFLTHIHFDHIYGLNEVLKKYSHLEAHTNSAGIIALYDDRKNMSRYHGHPFTCDYPDNVYCTDNNNIIPIDNNLSALAVPTPGHNPSSLTWIIGNALFTGDSFIPGMKTVSRLPGGNRKLAADSEVLIKQLSGDKIIYPGHKISET